MQHLSHKNPQIAEEFHRFVPQKNIVLRSTEGGCLLALHGEKQKEINTKVAAHLTDTHQLKVESKFTRKLRN